VKLNPRLVTRFQKATTDLDVVKAFRGLGCKGRATAFLDSWFAGEDLSAARSAAAEVSCHHPSDPASASARWLEDMEIELRRVDALGTPTYFVDGIRRAGYQEDGVVMDLIDRELSQAGALVKKGVKPDEVLGFMTSHGFSRSFLATEETPVHWGVVPDLAGKLPSGGSPEGSPPVLVYWMFHSPFCRNLQPHLLNLGHRKPKLSITVEPLSSSVADLSEAVGYICAARRGLALPMLQALASKDKLDRDELVTVASQLGMDRGPFVSCLDSPASLRLAKSIRSEAKALHIKGAPAVFVGKHRVTVPSGLDYYSLLAALEEAKPMRPR